MASKPITLEVQPRGTAVQWSVYLSLADVRQGKKIPKLPSETSIYLQGSSSDLYQRIATQSSFSIHRLRITKAEDGKLIPNDKSVSIDSTGLRDGAAIQVKDLGACFRMRNIVQVQH
jgi:very-long-chain enoyl-CoA reductase